MKLHFRVQHLAGRDEPLERLLKRLPPAVEVITDHVGEDERPNPLRNYLRCLADPPKRATHLIVIQDDAIPCKGIESKVKAAIDEKPDEVISLFVGGLSGSTKKNFLMALKRGDHWTQIYFREIHHVVALVWPVRLAADFLEFVSTAKIPGAPYARSDDAVVGYWARKTKNYFWATVPCLVEHPDDVPSTVHSLGRQGDKGRRAIAWIDDM